MSSHDGQALVRKPGFCQVSPLEIEGRSLEDKRYFSRAIRPSSLGPCTVGISPRKQKTFFPTVVPRPFRKVPVLILDYLVPSFALYFCRDFVQCRYEIRERVLKIDIFQGVSPTCVLH